MNKLLILDLDQTLIYSKSIDQRPTLSDNMFRFRVAGKQYISKFRPGLREFLQKVERKGWEIGIWTAATRPYMNTIKRHIFGSRRIKIKLCRDDCKVLKCFRRKFYAKPLASVVGEKRNIILVDDSKLVCKYNPQMSIKIKPWLGKRKHDTELERVYNRLCQYWD